MPSLSAKAIARAAIKVCGTKRSCKLIYPVLRGDRLNNHRTRRPRSKYTIHGSTPNKPPIIQ